MKRFKKLFLMAAVTILSIMSVSETVKADQYGRGIIINDDGEVEVIQEGLMPATGDVNALVFMVEFPDCKARDGYDKAYVENMFFGADDSMSEYYMNSSYGKLKIDGDVYGWYTTEHDREYYARTDHEYPPIENLFVEVINAYDDVIDYSEYDSDNDGYVDAIYIYYAGQEEYINSAWWTYVDNYLFSDTEPDNTKISQYGFINEATNYMIIAHETGHMLGLTDYYDVANTWNVSANFGGYSLMCSVTGELDALSKILLGWIEPIEVVSNESITLRPINEYPDAAVIYPDGDKKSKQFFIVEYASLTKNNRWVEGLDIDGLCVYRVNAETDEGGFKYGVTDSDFKLIQKLVSGIKEDGSRVTTYSSPATYIFEKDEAGNAVWTPTGINIDNMSFSNGEYVSCNVSYETALDTELFEYEIKDIYANNSLYFKIICGTDCLLKENAYANIISEDGHIIKIPITRDDYDDANNKSDFYSVLRGENLQSNTKYTVEIQENTFYTSYGAVNPKIIFTVQTSNYPEVSEYNMENSVIGTISDVYKADVNSYVYFNINSNGDVYRNVRMLDGSVERTILFKASLTDNGNGYDLRSCQLENGDIILSCVSWGITNVYRIHNDGSYETIIENMESYGYVSAVGNRAVIMKGGSRTGYIINEDNSIEEKDLEWGAFSSGVYRLENNVYVVNLGHMDGMVTVFNSDFEVIKEINCVDGVFYYNAFTYNDYYVIVGISSGYGLTAWYFDKDLNYISREKICEYGGGAGFTICDFKETEEGYVFGYSADMPIEEGASPVARIVYLDKNFNEVYFYTMDYMGEECGDSIVSILEMDNELVVFTDWYEYILHDAFPITLDEAGILMLSMDRNQVVAGMVVEPSKQTDIQYRWTAYNKTTQTTEVIQDWTDNNEWLNWSPSTFGEYEITAEARVKDKPQISVTAKSEAFEFNPHIKGKCQMPYYGEGGGYLIGVESYENPNQSYYYEMLILDCTLLAEGKDAWVYTTGKYRVGEGNAGWCIWQPQYGYYWTLFRVYDADGNMIDQACYGFANV